MVLMPKKNNALKNAKSKGPGELTIMRRGSSFVSMGSHILKSNNNSVRISVMNTVGC